jgi:hypothetical protein
MKTLKTKCLYILRTYCLKTTFLSEKMPILPTAKFQKGCKFCIYIIQYLKHDSKFIIFMAPCSLLLGGYKNSLKMEIADSSKELVTPTKHPHNVNTQKTAIRIFTTVKTSNFMSTVREGQA